MSVWSILVLAVGLSMDAFAVSVCKGLAMRRITLRKAVWVGLWFGGFQGLMPTLGYFLGRRFEGYIEQVDHWIAFVLLALIGVNMIRESFRKEETTDSLKVREMLVLAVATSIDALAVGITLGFMSVSVLPAALSIGCITFTLSVIGVGMGHRLGAKYETGAQRLGGVILILLGVKILLEHLEIF